MQNLTRRTAVPYVLVLAVLLGCCGCGSSGSSSSGASGGSGGGGGVSPPPTPSGTITAVSVSCNQATVLVGQTSQCNAAVQGTGTFNTSVNWSASAGTIVNGLYTPPSLKSYTVESVTATSTQDSTKSGAFAIAVQRSQPAGTWASLGPPGTAVAVLAQDASHPNVVYAGENQAGTGGVWKSSDAGATWSFVTSGTDMDVTTVADIEVLDGGNTLVAAGQYFTFKSTDGGNTWKEQTLPVTSAQVGATLVGALAVTPENDSVIYLSGRNYGVMKSTDEGSTWTLLSGSPKTGQILHNALAVDPNNPNVVYYGTDQGLFISRDAGQSWTASTTGISTTDTSIRDLVVDPANTNELLMIAGSPTSEAVDLYQSTNGGAGWTALAKSLDGERIVPDPSEANTIYLYGLQFHAVYRSTDGGATFNQSDGGMPPSGSSGDFIILSGPTGSMIILNDAPRTFLATEGNIYRSPDGQNWTLSVQGISGYLGSAVVADPRNPGTLFLTTLDEGGIFRSSDGGTTWTQTYFGGDAHAIAIDPFDSTHVLAAAISQGLMESHDGGLTWSQVTNLPSPPANQTAYIMGISFDPTMPGVILISTQGAGIPVLRSTDGGASWQIASSGLPSSDSYSPVVVSPSDSMTVYLGMFGGLYKSTDLGDSWSIAGLSGEQVYGVAIDGNASPPTIYASLLVPGVWTNGLYKSQDAGVTWANLNVGGTVVVDPSSANSLFLMDGSTVSWSPDGGETWMSMSAGLGMAAIGYNGWDWSYAVARTQPQALYATSTNRSLFRFVTGP
jgi:photosystem II stability/assembly factor-like uncharacterized protein